ncbi:hypothetical protein P154DRAFT_575106 [Amniculicola lignicola CBS 123094]|uniref:Uncharacterized protein n=1 Tax=Amniculicola lignicola CBS 123094 TaxID=1392246 RepID=A0A6A5WQM4_9PLEO|nr:hypothetical protein P154DRAFT_575106 [Amniculicola lignicola CBS 123094]
MEILQARCGSNLGFLELRTLTIVDCELRGRTNAILLDHISFPRELKYDDHLQYDWDEKIHPHLFTTPQNDKLPQGPKGFVPADVTTPDIAKRIKMWLNICDTKHTCISAGGKEHRNHPDPGSGSKISLGRRNGSTEDWLREGTRMDVIYVASYLTIAVDGAHPAQDRFLFEERNILSITDCTHPHLVVPFRMWIHDTVHHQSRINCPELVLPRLKHDRNVLSSRGWTLQERLLSRRIVSLNQYEMSRECDELEEPERMQAGANKCLRQLTIN